MAEKARQQHVDEPTGARLQQRWASRALQLLAWFESLSLVQSALALFLAFAVVYLATASYGPYHWDTFSASVPAWRFATAGTLRADEFLGTTPWFVDTGQGVYSNRFPGVIFVAVPAYWLADRAGLVSADQVSFAPAAVTAALLTAAAMATLYLVFTTIATRRAALLAAVAAGLATGTWSVSADALWTHGPGQLYAAVALLSIAGGHYLPAGASFGLATFTRPQLAVIPLVMGLHATWRERSLWPAAAIGTLSAAGLAALVLYNRAVFGDLNVTGGYDTYATENLAGMTPLTYLTNWLLTLFSPVRGVVVYSPFLVPAVLGWREAWRSAPSWVRAAAVSGIVYMALQLRLNHYAGGDTFFSYRLPLDGLTLMAPLLLLAALCWMRRGAERPRLFTSLVVAAAVLQAYGATVYEHIIAGKV